MKKQKKTSRVDAATKEVMNINKLRKENRLDPIPNGDMTLKKMD
ncbi:hypothetical protein [Amphibacillus xylanus]|nr:hypothetical protein [Amphibacillus xylanus]